jgi:hypothetical protein
MDHRLADVRYQCWRIAKELKRGGGSRNRITCSPALPLHSTDTSSTRFMTSCRQISGTQFSSPDEVSVGGSGRSRPRRVRCYRHGPVRIYRAEAAACQTSVKRTVAVELALSQTYSDRYRRNEAFSHHPPPDTGPRWFSQPEGRGHGLEHHEEWRASNVRPPNTRAVCRWVGGDSGCPLRTWPDSRYNRSTSTGHPAARPPGPTPPASAEPPPAAPTPTESARGRRL